MSDTDEYRMTVDGIESRADNFDDHVQPMFTIRDDGGGGAVMRCSQPLTEDEQRAWLAGDEGSWGVFL